MNVSEPSVVVTVTSVWHESQSGQLMSPIRVTSINMLPYSSIRSATLRLSSDSASVAPSRFDPARGNSVVVPPSTRIVTVSDRVGAAAKVEPWLTTVGRITDPSSSSVEPMTFVERLRKFTLEEYMM